MSKLLDVGEKFLETKTAIDEAIEGYVSAVGEAPPPTVLHDIIVDSIGGLLESLTGERNVVVADHIRVQVQELISGSKLSIRFIPVSEYGLIAEHLLKSIHDTSPVAN